MQKEELTKKIEDIVNILKVLYNKLIKLQETDQLTEEAKHMGKRLILDSIEKKELQLEYYMDLFNTVHKLSNKN